MKTQPDHETNNRSTHRIIKPQHSQSNIHQHIQNKNTPTNIPTSTPKPNQPVQTTNQTPINQTKNMPISPTLIRPANKDAANISLPHQIILSMNNAKQIADPLNGAKMPSG